MADYISRQAAIDRFENLSYADWNQGASTTWANAFSECADMIRELPSEYVVEVVRCRYCKHWWDVIPSNITLMGKRWQFCQKQKEMFPEDGFCWLGARMDGDGYDPC